MKKIQPQDRYVAGKGKNILIAFSDNCGYYLIPHQNLNDSFLKVNCHVDSKTISELFGLLFTKIHWSILYFEWTFYPCMILSCNCIAIRKHWFTELCNSFKC